MKIKKLVVKNYKVFDHLELDFTDKNGQVLDTIVLAGLNGSGKTTVLELLRDLIDGNTPQYLRENTEFKLEILFAKRNFVNHTFPNFEHNDLIYHSSFPKSEEYDILFFEYKGTQNRINDFELLGHTLDFLYGNMQFIDTIHQAIYFYANEKHIKREKGYGNIIEATFAADSQLIKLDILFAIQQTVFSNPDQTPRSIFTQQVNNLNKIFKNLNIKSKLIQLSEKDMTFESVNGQKIGFDDLSSGEKMLYFMGFTLNQYNPQDALIMVDEPEDSLHPKWQQQIVRFFNNVGSNNQVILATHSPQIIASVHPESLFVLAINDETHRVEAINMADEHKYTYGVDPNRILSEIMGTPIRDFETQQRIKAISDLIKQVEFNPSVSGVSQVEKEINLLAEDLGKQDASIMRFRNEILLLKRKLLVAQ